MLRLFLGFEEVLWEGLRIAEIIVCKEVTDDLLNLLKELRNAEMVFASRRSLTVGLSENIRARFMGYNLRERLSKENACASAALR
jgi:hypothetical protein